MSRVGTRVRQGGLVKDLAPAFVNNVELQQTDNSWVRPSDWLTFTSPGYSNYIQMLVPIYADDSNFFSFVCATSAGTFTVDWGNGTVQTFASGTTVSQQILWSQVSSGTLTSEGYRQAIITVWGTLDLLSSFEIRRPTQLQAQPDLQINEIVGSGTNITNFRLGTGTTSATVLYGAPYSMRRFQWYGEFYVADMSYLFSSCVSLHSVDFGTTFATTLNFCFNNCFSLQNVKINSLPSATNMTGMFSSCRSLKYFECSNTASVTTTSSMFSGCYALQSVDLPNLQTVTTASSMFFSCASLQRVNLPNLQALQSADSMFQGCASLKSIDLSNTTALTNTTSMFASCNTLISVRIPNMGSVTLATSMFTSCTSLKSVTLGTLTSVANAQSMFNNCYTLNSVTLNLPAATNVQGIFSNCSSLQSATLLGCGSVTNFGSAFTGCFSLKTFSIASMSSATSIASMFQGCQSILAVNLPANSLVTSALGIFNNCTALQTVTGLNGQSTTGSSGFSSAFNACYSLQKISATNMKYTHSISFCKMSADALNAYYTALPTVTGQTLTVTSNWGTATDNPAIATAKGWTVTG